MKKVKAFLLLAAAITLLTSFNAFANMSGDFMKLEDENGIMYWVYIDSGEYAKERWIQTPDDRWFYAGSDTKLYQNKWLNNKNGKWYYFGNDCSMQHNVTTPDGYQVGSDGAWIRDGQVVVENVNENVETNK